MKTIYYTSLMVAAVALLVLSVPVYASKMDSRIESTARKSYVFKTYLKDDDIKIQSKDGAVTLTGTVSEESHRSLARETVTGLPGVKTVDDKLEVKGAAERRINMNEDILKGEWLEIQGRVKEKWGKLSNNEFVEIEGKGEKLLGLLQKRYGYIREKAELEYKDSVELAEIVSRIGEISTKKTDIATFAFLAHYGRPLLAKNQESQIAGKVEKHDYIDRYSYTRLSKHNTHPALR